MQGDVHNRLHNHGLAALARLVGAVITLVLMGAGVSLAAFPSGPIEIIAPASPGGGWDTTARTIQKVLLDERLVSVPVNVVNRPGGGGQVGWAYLNEHRGNGHYLAMNSTQLFPPELTGRGRAKVEDFTPLARLTSEWQVLAVRADSPFKNGREFLEALRKEPGSLSVGIGSGVASDDHVSFLKAAKSVGVDIRRVRIVVFSSGGDQTVALLGGNVDAISTGLSEIEEQVRAGKARLLAISSPERLSGDLAATPTWAELGVDGTFAHWRGVMGPGGMPAEQVTYWDEVFGRMVQTERWRREIALRGWADAYLASQPFRQYLLDSREEFAGLLREVGFIK